MAGINCFWLKEGRKSISPPQILASSNSPSHPLTLSPSHPSHPSHPLSKHLPFMYPTRDAVLEGHFQAERSGFYGFKFEFGPAVFGNFDA